MRNQRLHKLKIGFALRCPVCEQGYIGRFRIRHTCSYCQCRFERSPREQIGGWYLTAFVAQATAVIGFMSVETLFHPSPLLQILFWIPYTVVFALLFYPRARGLSVAINALRGKVYPDFDCDREYIAQEQHRTFGKTQTPQENE